MESLSPFASVKLKHQHAPLLPERELYLSHLLREGVDRKVVRSTASYLLHIIRILNMSELRIVEEAEIEQAGQFWAGYRGPFRRKDCIPGAPGVFVRIAKSRLLFHGKLAMPPAPPFQDLIAQFSKAMLDRGLATPSVEGYSLGHMRF